MAAQVKVGSFTWSSGALGTEVITGVGFQPVLVIILAQDLSSFGAFAEEQNVCVGFGTAAGAGNNKTMVYGSGWHGGTVLPTAVGGIADDRVITHINAAEFLNMVASLVSLDADGFTVEASSGGTDGEVFQYIAIGGAGVSAKIGTATWNTSTGPQAITGVGFEPSVVMLGAVVETDGAVSWGWCDGALRQGAVASHFLDVASAPSQSKRYYSVTSALALLSPTTGALVGLANVDSLDADGFTLDWTTAYGSSGTFAYIALAGVNAHAGVVTQPSSTGDQVVSSLSVTPAAVMLASTGQTAAATVDDSFRLALGFGQVGANQCAWSGDIHAAANFPARRSMRYASDTAAVLAAVPTGTNTGTVEAAASVSAAASGSFTLNWATADATARQLIYLALDGAASVRVTQLVALLVQDRDPDPAIVADPTGGGTVGSGTDPSAGVDLCGAETPVAYMELTPPGSSTTYRLSKVPINRTVADRPIVQQFGTIVRSLSNRQGDVRGSRFNPLVSDTDRFLRGLEATDSLVNSRLDAYVTTLAALIAGSAARRVYSGLVIESQPESGLLMRLQSSGYLQTLLDLTPAATYPARVFSVADFPNLANDPSDPSSPGNPSLIGKPVPIGYGVLSDEALGAAARGVVPAWFVGKRLVDGFDWDEYVIFGHAPAPGGILGFFGDNGGVRMRFDSTYEGVDFLWPGYAGWNLATGSTNLYRDYNGHRYTVVYARGPRSDSARDGRIPFSINIGGVEDVGDGTGDVITSLARQALHFLTNFVVQTYTSGAWLSPPTVNGYSRINTPSFEAVRTRSGTRLGTTEGYLGAFLLGWDGGTVTLRDLLRRWSECGLDIGENADGQIMASMIDPTATPARSVSDITDTLRQSFRARRIRSEIRNTVTYRYQRRYVPALPETTPAAGAALPGSLRRAQVAWEVDNVAPTPDSASVTKYGTRELDLSLELIRDAATAADIAALNQEVLAPGPVMVGYREGLCGTNVDLGDTVSLDHFEGLTASGYTGQTLRCEQHTLDLDRFETEVEGLDVEAL